MSCCPTTITARKSDYVPKTVPFYETGAATSAKVLVFVYDIFGMSPQVRQVADLIADATGYRVIIPDFFDGKPWPMEKFPPGEGDDLMGWIKSAGDYSRIRALLVPVLERVRAQGAKSVGLVGFCWGARMCMNALQEGLVDAVALCHPSFVEDKDFEGGIASLKGGVAILRSKDEAPMQPTKDIFAAANSPKFVVADFDNMHHGFMGARADFNDAENVKAVEEGVKIVSNFFAAAL